MAQGRSSFFIIILTVIITSISFLVAAEENILQADDWEEGVISVSTHGKVQHGDKIYFRLEKSNWMFLNMPLYFIQSLITKE